MALSDAVPYAVAHWTLDETSGTRFDSVGSNDLTDNSTGSATGMFDNAADFERGSVSYLTTSDNTDLSAGDVLFFLRVWVKLESKPAGASSNIITKGDGTNGDYYLYYDDVGSVDRFKFTVYGASGYGSATTVVADNLGSPNTDTWYLLHAWHDPTANEIGIAVNAGTADTASHSLGIYDSTGPFYLGRSAFFDAFDGLMDDAVILKGYVLNSTERSSDYNSGAGVAFADWDAGGMTGSPWYYFLQQ